MSEENKEKLRRCVADTIVTKNLDKFKDARRLIRAYFPKISKYTSKRLIEGMALIEETQRESICKTISKWYE